MPAGTTQVVQCRWDQVVVGDTIIDYRWAYPRWETVRAITVIDGTVHALWSASHEDPETLPLNKWYRCPAARLVDVQVVST